MNRFAQALFRESIYLIEQGVTTAEEIDRATMPSLVLRRLREGETLWDVAKQCKTEEQAILAANELESGTETTDMLLLIPKVR